MIRIMRSPEPANLAAIRATKLSAIRALGRDPTSNEIEGYRVVAEELWRSQHHKCCYCETRIPQGYNDVEHYRPKAAADRRPGCASTHGYWWLAFSWENLLFACPDCNRSHKNSKFPLNYGCQPLMPEDLPPGSESPLLIDPSSAVNPVEHIEFVYRGIAPGATRTWWARPRNGSILGNETIEVCGLNRSDLREIREDHYSSVVLPHSRAIEQAMASKDINRLQDEFYRALDQLKSRCIHVGLTYDAFQHTIPNATLQSRLGVTWPEANLIPM
jgi:uncharacterized protein (TIGR02646 family)